MRRPRPKPPHLLQHLVRRLEGVEAGRDAAIDGGVEKHFLDLLDRDAVILGAAHMELHLRRAVERRQHGEVEHAPRLAVEPLAVPGIAPTPFGHHVLERHHEVVGRLQRIVDISGAEHLAPGGKPLVEQVAQRFGLVVGHRFLPLWTGHYRWIARKSTQLALFSRDGPPVTSRSVQ
jgi:hypothetical protein